MSIDPNMKIVCPHCGQPSDNIKRLNIMTIIFLFIGVRWETQQVTACGNCMRTRILGNAIINILSANVLWPFFILPHSIYNAIQSYQPGHSEGVLSEIRYRTRSGPTPDQIEAIRAAAARKRASEQPLSSWSGGRVNNDKKPPSPFK